ncbi:MAG: hypothetical protein HC821_04650 [Lewinella sp.]|nr:hypothetical protein [Lewinella sp.]
MAPGLWQHLSLEFRAPRFDQYGRKLQNARLLALRINGIVVHQNIELTRTTPGQSPGY